MGADSPQPTTPRSVVTSTRTDSFSATEPLLMRKGSLSGTRTRCSATRSNFSGAASSIASILVLSHPRQHLGRDDVLGALAAEEARDLTGGPLAERVAHLGAAGRGDVR